MTLPFWPRHARKLSGKGNTKNYYQISLNLLGRLCKVITGQLNNLNLLEVNAVRRYQIIPNPRPLSDSSTNWQLLNVNAYCQET